MSSPPLIPCRRSLHKDFLQIMRACAWPEIFKKIEGREPRLKVMDVTEFLAKEIELNTKDLSPTKMKVTYHDPCDLRRGQGVCLEPREIIRKIPGIELVEMSEPDRCCGAGGGLRSGNRDLSLRVAEAKVDMIKETGAEAIVTVCPYCQLQFRDLINRGSLRDMKVINVVNLLANSYKR